MDRIELYDCYDISALHFSEDHLKTISDFNYVSDESCCRNIDLVDPTDLKGTLVTEPTIFR